MENIQKFFEDFIEYFGPEKINEIPSKYRSQKVWNEFVKQDGRLGIVPKKYRTREMYNIYIDRPGSNINIIPKEFLDQEIYDRFINRGGNMKLVPPEFQNQEMCDKYIDNGGDIQVVLSKFQNQELWIKYIRNGGKINVIPEKYLTQSMYLELSKRGSFDIADVPKKYLNQEIINEYVKKSRTISFVPKEYLNQELVDYVIENGQSIRVVPEEYLTKEIVDKYFENTGTIKLIPEKFLTKEMCDKYLEMGGKVDNVPKKFQTLEMWVQALLSGVGDWNMPPEFRTQELWNLFIEKGGRIQRVPKMFLNNELYKKYIELGGSLKNIPNIYNRDKKEIEKPINEKLLNKLKEYFKNTSRSEITRRGMLEFMDVSEFTLTRFLQSIEEKNPQLYDEIKKIFQINSNKHFFLCLEKAVKIEEILNVMDFSRNLSKEQKVYFSYLYDQLDNKKAIMEVYRIVKGRKDVPMFLLFCNEELGYKYSKLKDGEISLLEEERFLMNKKGIWFSPFRVKDRIGDEKNNTLKYKYQTKYNDEVEITKDNADMIIDFLQENNISTRVCVVEEAFRRFANGELNDFVYELRSGEYLNTNSEEIKK